MTKKYRIVYSAEGSAEGIVELTDEEYEIVSRVLNINNWEHKEIEDWSPSVWIEPPEEFLACWHYCEHCESCEKRQDFEAALNCEDWLDDEEEDEE